MLLPDVFLPVKRPIPMLKPLISCWKRSHRTTIAGETFRVPEPYLVMATLLQAMMEGMDAGKSPPPPVSGNAYEEAGDAPFLPDDMDEALQLMENSKFAERALGPVLFKIFKDLKRAEIVAFWSEITPLERTTYL